MRPESTPKRTTDLDVREESYSPAPFVGVVLEGAADFFFGRPLSENPYARSWNEPWEAWKAWEAWNYGWGEAEWFEQLRGERERARWQQGDRRAREG
jgi:hypothetical protein